LSSHSTGEIELSAYWYETFFSGIVLDMWRGVMTPEVTGAEADFIETELSLAAAARVLDVPCGNGRHAVELAARGYHITGVDLSPGFIEEARRQNSSATFVESDMRRLPAGPFDGAYCFGNSFGYLEDGGDQRFLEAVAGALRPGARFILETGHAAESLLSNLKDEATYQVGDIRMDLRHEYDAPRSVLRTRFSFTRDGATDARWGEAHLYTTAELRRMLERAGLYPIALYGAIDRTPYRVRSQRLLLVAELRE
jgi:SAM-dependent methyltransferase